MDTRASDGREDEEDAGHAPLLSAARLLMLDGGEELMMMKCNF